MRKWLAVAGMTTVAVCVAVTQNTGIRTVAAQSEPTELPAGPAKTIVLRSCTVCHSVDNVLGKRATPQEWADTVNTMVSRGADLSDAEIPIVVKYLAAAFPAPNTAAPAPAAPTPAAPAAPQAQGPLTALPPGPAKAIIERSCTVCHGVDTVLGWRDTPEGWAAKVNTMISRGADLSDKEIPVVVKYLSDNLPLQKSAMGRAPAPTQGSKARKADAMLLAELHAAQL